MKITLTLNEVLTLIAEGMTMNNVTSLANKLRNADAPVAASDSNLQRAQAKAGTWEAAYNAAMVDLEVAKQNLKSANQLVYDYERALEKAKQTEITLRDSNLQLSQLTDRLKSKLRDLENDAKLDAESLKYFRKWLKDLRIATGYDEGVTSATVFSNTIELVRQHNELCKRAADLESKLVKANDVIATVKAAYDADEFNDDKISLITSAVEGYYRGD